MENESYSMQRVNYNSQGKQMLIYFRKHFLWWRSFHWMERPSSDRSVPGVHGYVLCSDAHILPIVLLCRIAMLSADVFGCLSWRELSLAKIAKITCKTNCFTWRMEELEVRTGGRLERFAKQLFLPTIQLIGISSRNAQRLTLWKWDVVKLVYRHNMYDLPIVSDEETFLKYFLAILKYSLQNC